jgi:hypothetical protein
MANGGRESEPPEWHGCSFRTGPVWHCAGPGGGPMVSQCGPGDPLRVGRPAGWFFPCGGPVSHRPWPGGRRPLRGWITQHEFASHRTDHQQAADASFQGIALPTGNRRRTFDGGPAESKTGGTVGLCPNLVGPSAGSCLVLAERHRAVGARWGRALRARRAAVMAQAAQSHLVCSAPAA